MSLLKKIIVCVSAVWIVMLMGWGLTTLFGFFGYMLTIFTACAGVIAFAWHSVNP